MADEQQGQERRHRDMRAAAQAHCDVEAQDGSIAENFAQVEDLAFGLLRDCREARQAALEADEGEEEGGHHEPRKLCHREAVEEGDDDDRCERVAEVAARDVVGHRAALAFRRRRLGDERRAERVEGRDGEPREGNDDEEHRLRRDQANRADADGAERDDRYEDAAEVVAVHDVAEDGLHHVARDGQDHDKKAADRQRDAELRHDDRQQDRQEIAVEIIEEVACAQ